MNTLKDSRKTRYTERILNEALLELLRKEPSCKITVTELCRQADINRNTFYLHYRDVYDLLEHTEQDIYDIILKSLDCDEAFVSCEEDLSRLLRAAYENRDMVRILLSGNLRPDSVERAFSSLNGRLLEMWKSWFPELSEQQLQYAMAYASGGTSFAIKRWFDTGTKESPAELAAMLAPLAPRQTLGRLGSGGRDKS